MECLTLRELQAIASEAVGREVDDAKMYKDLEEWSKCLWGKQPSSGGTQMDERDLKRQQTIEEWELKLETMDLQRRNGKRKREDVEMSQ